jgi:hypothetical protein
MTLLCGAENIGYLPGVINLANIYADDDEIRNQEYVHLNMASMYILARVTSSQCMGLAGSGFKNMKASRTMLARRFPALPDADPPLEALPYITPQTVAYALSLVMSCVCYSVNDPMTKGRAAQLYEKVLANYSKLSDKEFQSSLRANLTEWVSKVTSPEPPEPEVPMMSLQQVAAADRARPSGAAAEDGDADADECGDIEEDGEAEEDEKAGTADGDGDGAADGDGDGAADGDGDGTANGGNGSDDGGTSSRKTTPSPGRPKKNNTPKPPDNAAKPKAKRGRRAL